MSRMKLGRVMPILVGVIFAIAVASPCGAQKYPGRSISMVVPFTPGGPQDVTARLVAPRMSESMGVPIVIENMGGASGLVGASYVARAKPDGYTLLYVAGSTYTIAPSLRPKMNIDMLKQFTPVSSVQKNPQVVYVNANVPVKTLRELADYARANPGKLNYASPGAGNIPHLTAELLKRRGGFDAVHVPYKGGADMMRAVLSEQAHFAVDSVGAVLPHLSGNRIRVIAIADSKRSPKLISVPTFAEAGFQNTVILSWSAILAPAGTPPDIIARLNAEVAKALKNPEVVARFDALNVEAYPSTPEELREAAEKEIAMWAPLIKEAGLAEQ